LKVYLPQAEEAGETPWPALELAPTPRGPETLLLVEDQDEVRERARDSRGAVAERSHPPCR
jgi:hypothetical protein